MMIRILKLIPIIAGTVLCSGILKAQVDSTDIIPIDSIRIKIVNAVPSFVPDCIHSHICCSVGCDCCPELKLPQQYDELERKVSRDVVRVTVVERHPVAASNEKSPVHYRFEKNGKMLRPRYFNAKLSSFGGFPYGFGYGLSPSDISLAEQFDDKGKLVFDEDYDFLLIDDEGNELAIPFQSNIKVADDCFRSSILLHKTRIYGLSDGKGRKKGPLTYRRMQHFDKDGLCIVESMHRKFGIINKDGEQVVPPQYHEIDRLAPGYFAVRSEKGTELINAKGRTISRRAYEDIGDYSEGLAFAKSKKYICYLDENGKEAFRLRLEWGYEFKDGLAAVFDGSSWGYINTKGEIVINPNFDRAGNFYGGVAPVGMGKNSNKDAWGLIDKQGNYITSSRYSAINHFKDGIARTFINGKGYGFLTTDGDEFMKCIYSIDSYGDDTTYFHFGLLIRQKSGDFNSLELVNKEGIQLLDLTAYLSARFCFVPGFDAHYLPLLTVWRKNEKVNLMDLRGKIQLERDYDVISIYDDLTAVGTRGKQQFVIHLDSKKEIFELKGGKFTRYEDGIFTLERDYKYLYYDRYGKVIKPFD